MKKISSDSQFYNGLTGYLIGPILITLFIKYIMNSDVLKYVGYTFLIILLIWQGWILYRSRHVVWDYDELILTNYFNKKSENVPIVVVLSLKKAFSLQREAKRNLYKLTYQKNNKSCSIYFFKALELDDIEDLSDYIGVK
jgi:hypothetical protein